MTIKERIEAFVLNQGNHVGAGAELAAILKDIVDSIPGAYTLPPASAETLGGVKVGSGLSVTEQGVLSASGGGAQPLIVEGTISNPDNFIFAPASGQPSFTDALNAFQSGVPVILRAENPDDNAPHDMLVVEYCNDGAGNGEQLISRITQSLTGGGSYPLFWVKPQD